MSVDPRLYFLMRRLKSIQEKYFENTEIRLIDIGCADGSFMQIAVKHLTNIEKIDGVDVPSKWLKEVPVRSIGNLYIQDLQCGIGKIPEGVYHIATLWEVIEHIENVYDFLRNLKKVLVPNGIALLSTPNLLGLSRFIKGSNWVGIADQTHRYLFDKLTLNMVLDRAGFSNISISNYFFPSLGSGFDVINNAVASVPGGGMFFLKASNKKK